MTRWWWPGATLALVLAFSSHAMADGTVPLSNAGDALSQLAKDLADQSLPVAQRVEIVRALGGWGGEQVRAPLLATLKDPAPPLRAIAARGLGWPGNREAIPALRERVEAPDEATVVKAAAVEALGLIGDRGTRPLLVEATKHPDAGIRQAALAGLSFGPLADPADRVTYLMQLAEDRALQGLPRCDAVRELFSVHEERVVDAFLRILENEPRFAIAPPEGPSSQQQTMELRRVQARDVSAWVAEGLGQLKAKRGIPVLMKTAEDKSDFFLRLMSLRALVALDALEAAPVFTRRLEDQMPENRILGILGLAQIGDRAAIPALMGRLTDPSPLVRAQAVSVLAAFGGPEVKPALEDLQRRETESNVQGAIEEGLAHLSR